MSIPDISDLLDAHLLAKRDAEGDRPVAGGMTWRASKLGSCLRQQYLELHLKQPKLEEFDALSLRRFEVGHQWGRQFARWFRDMGYDVEEEVELYNAALDVGAHGDFVVRGPGFKVGIELKSVNSRWFWRRTNDGEMTTASPDHMMQAATYQLLTGHEFPWMVLSVSKDDLTMIQDVVTDEHCNIAMHRLAILNGAKATGVPPPCTCLDDWRWRYCGFYSGSDESKKTQHSEKTGELYANGKPKYRKAYKPDGECCKVLVPV